MLRYGANDRLAVWVKARLASPRWITRQNADLIGRNERSFRMRSSRHDEVDRAPPSLGCFTIFRSRPRLHASDIAEADVPPGLGVEVPSRIFLM